MGRLMAKLDQDLEALKREAERILKLIPEGIAYQPTTSRPKFIEFAGTPKSGKSTCIDTVSHFFKRTGFKVLAPTEGASKRTPYYLKDDLVSFNVWSACYALSHILEGLYSSDRFHLVFLDRGLFDALAWINLLQVEGDVTLEECNVIQSFLLVSQWREVVDIVFQFEADAESSLQREHQHKLITEPGRAMNSEFLDKLNQSYNTVREKYSNRFQGFKLIDTSNNRNTTPQSTAFEVTQHILRLWGY